MKFTQTFLTAAFLLLPATEGLKAEVLGMDTPIPLESTFAELAGYYERAEPATFEEMAALRLPASRFESFWQAGLCKYEAEGKLHTKPSILLGANGPDGTRFGNYFSSDWKAVEDNGTELMNYRQVQKATAIPRDFIFPVLRKIIRQTLPDKTDITGLNLKSFYRLTHSEPTEDVLIQHPRISATPGRALSFTRTARTSYAFFEGLLISKTVGIAQPTEEDQKLKEMDGLFKEGIIFESYCIFPVSMIH